MHLFLDSFIFDKITHNNPIRKMNHLFQIHSVCTCARNMYILALAGCAPKETCEIALKMRECCQQSCKLCCKMTKMMAFNLDDYFPLCPFHVPSGILVELYLVLVEFRMIVGMVNWWLVLIINHFLISKLIFNCHVY